MKITWGTATPGVMFAAKVETCTRQGRQFANSTNSTRAGTPCKVWPLEKQRTQGRQFGHFGAVYGGGEGPAAEGAANNQGARGRKEKVTAEGTAPQSRARREVVMLTNQETGETTFQMRVRADPMSEKQRSEARNAYRSAEGLETGANEANPPADRAGSQDEGAGTGEE